LAACQSCYAKLKGVDRIYYLSGLCSGWLTATRFEYAGNYYSDELGTAYTVVVHEGKLVAQHRRHDDISLTPLAQDTFLGSQWFFQRVRFTRDKDGHVTGMRVTGGRVRNMRFDRQ
jgi:hypothetical protein